MVLGLGMNKEEGDEGCFLLMIGMLRLITKCY